MKMFKTYLGKCEWNLRKRLDCQCAGNDLAQNSCSCEWNGFLGRVG